MTFDIRPTALHAAQPLSRILCHQLNDIKSMLVTTASNKIKECIPHPFANILSLFTQSLGIGDRVVGDGCKQLILVIPVKWRLPDQHLIEQDAK